MWTSTEIITIIYSVSPIYFGSVASSASRFGYACVITNLGVRKTLRDAAAAVQKNVDKIMIWEEKLQYYSPHPKPR